MVTSLPSRGQTSRMPLQHDLNQLRASGSQGATDSLGQGRPLAYANRGHTETLRQGEEVDVRAGQIEEAFRPATSLIPRRRYS